MGFEVLFKYHERLEEGGYDKEDEKEMSKKVGKAYDDVLRIFLLLQLILLSQNYLLISGTSPYSSFFP